MYTRLSDAWISERDISLETNVSEISLNKFDPMLAKAIPVCDKSWKHVKECMACQARLKKLLDAQVEDRLDRLLLEKKLSKISKDFQWKDAAMVGLGTAVVVLLLLLVLKQK